MHQGISLGDVKRIKLDGNFLGRTEERWTGKRSGSGEDGFLGKCLRGSKLEELRNPKQVSFFDVHVYLPPAINNGEKRDGQKTYLVGFELFSVILDLVLHQR